MLSDETAEDQFALHTLKPDMIRLFNKCIKGGGVGAGFVVVGPRGVIALTMKPTPDGLGPGRGRGDRQAIGGFNGTDLTLEKDLEAAL